jgi:hypothetical protein
MKEDYSIGLDVHSRAYRDREPNFHSKIAVNDAVAIARAVGGSRAEPRYEGQCGGSNLSVERALRKLAKGLGVRLRELKVCSEAGPTGFDSASASPYGPPSAVGLASLGCAGPDLGGHRADPNTSQSPAIRARHDRRSRGRPSWPHRSIPARKHAPSPANPHPHSAKSFLVSPRPALLLPALFNNQFHSGLRRNETSGLGALSAESSAYDFGNLAEVHASPLALG